MMTLYNELDNIIKRREKASLCTIIATKGSVPLKTGAKMIVYENGKISGSIGGGALEFAVTREAMQMAGQKKGKVSRHELVKDHAMCCGGTVEVFIEPIILPWQLLLFGAGHIGNKLAKMAGELGFNVFLIDERAEFGKGPRMKNVTRVHSHPGTYFERVRADENSMCVIMTHLHARDREVLSWAVRQPFGYIGMIGSMRKVLVTKRLFTENGIATEEELNRVKMPVGIDIGAHSHEEIAVSIAAELIMVRSGTGPSGSQSLSENKISTEPIKIDRQCTQML